MRGFYLSAPEFYSITGMRETPNSPTACVVTLSELRKMAVISSVENGSSHNQLTSSIIHY